MSVRSRNTICKHIEASDTFYVDLGPLLEASETVSSVSGVTSDDAALTIANAAVISSNTTVRDEYGDSLTIEANTGVQFDLSVGTVTTDSDAAALVTVVFVKSTGGIDAVDCQLNVRGRDV